jgi:hypothetical protein
MSRSGILKLNPTKDKTMTDFNEWYAIYEPDLDPTLDDFRDELRKAYEAGAASQAGTLRDEFAGQALAASIQSEGVQCSWSLATWSYKMSDAMLEARKTTGEGE